MTSPPIQAIRKTSVCGPSENSVKEGSLRYLKTIAWCRRSNGTLAILTRIPSARYPQGKSWGQIFRNIWMAPTNSRCMGRRPRASNALFTHCLVRGHICIHYRYRRCCADRTDTTSGKFISRQNCTGITIRISAFASTSCLGSLWTTGKPDLPCACDEPRNKSTTNMGHLSRKRTAWLPRLFNSATAYRSK